MDALLRFCLSTTGMFVLGLLWIGSTSLLGVMAFTTLFRWLIRFVKESWD